MALSCALAPPQNAPVELLLLPEGGTFFFNQDYWLKSARMYDDHTSLCVRLTAVAGHAGDDGGIGVGVSVVPVDLQLILK